MDKLIMTPSPGDRLVRYVGDRVNFSLHTPGSFEPGWRAMLRTNLGKASRLREEVISTHAGKNPLSIAFWRDVPLRPQPSGQWAIDLPLTDVGFYRAKPYLLDPAGKQYWPDGSDIGISVHPNVSRTANTIYCAFPRMFGQAKTLPDTSEPVLGDAIKLLDGKGYAVIPPSGTLRDLQRELPHIMDTLGCRILQLLPVGPVPTTFARFGRFGSPYACLNLTAIDPALVEFDQRSNGVEQFCELTNAVHRRSGRVLLDMVINHTGWGSYLFERHPEWFLRHENGDFASPGAWGVTWEDLVELNPGFIELWDELAEAFLIWCRRGVDGFRCDAGYKVPVPVWQYIEARVRQEFPDAIFLLEGLGGPLEATDALLAEGGMQWAYSELFQNYSGPEVARYLDYSTRQSQRAGVYIHFSETHDNERLSTKGRAWSLMRNRLSALSSIAGGFAFTCGVEWLAAERVNVHSARGLAWNSKENLVKELGQLNALLAEHPCFFDGAKLRRLSPENSPVYALRRESAEGKDAVLVLVNTDVEAKHELSLSAEEYEQCGSPLVDLLGQAPLKPTREKDEFIFGLPPGAVFCLAATAKAAGLAGEKYRQARAQTAVAMTALGKILLPEEIGPCAWSELAQMADHDLPSFLGSILSADRARTGVDLLGALQAAAKNYPCVVLWEKKDYNRIVCVPPGHWLLVKDSHPFRVCLTHPPDEKMEVAESAPIGDGCAAFFAPRHPDKSVDARLVLERFEDGGEKVVANIRFLSATPSLPEILHRPPPDSLVLLTNGRGGMARLGTDLGRINSKYDCALGANLHDDFPVDRHILAKRIRAWITADGFTTALNLQNLSSIAPGPPAVWIFVADAGDGRTVEIRLTADMVAGCNTTVFAFERLPDASPSDLSAGFYVKLTVRVDIEDRNFHSQTEHNGGAEIHFTRNCRTLDGEPGFIFAPAPDRILRAVASTGVYHDAPEWCDGIRHAVEESRGQVGSGDAYSPGWFELPMLRTEVATLALSSEKTVPTSLSLQCSLADRAEENQTAWRHAELAENDPFGQRLAIAARAFVARRGSGKTVIAGYPWFLDWGRDSLISARGLLAAGLTAEVVDLLVTFGRFCENGLMPNTIHGDNASNRDTTDAPLWYGIVCQEAAELTGESLYQTVVDKTGRTIADVLVEIALGYSRGTSNGIRMDARSGLIWSPSHFTWMDTNYPAGTPREGYPVEIQSMWIRLLRLVHRLGLKTGGESWKELADRAEASLLHYYWLEDRGYIADLLIAAPGASAAQAVVDNALRNNFLFALAFDFFPAAQARRGVDAALRHLWVPGAMRTLAPLPVAPPLIIRAPDGHPLNNPDEPYWGRYQGDEDTSRKPAYHNGTAWVWLLPTACEALAKAWGRTPAAVAAAKSYLGSMDKLLLTNCLGQLPEILDGDAPHQARGCDAQAWSVTEALRVWKWLAV